MQKQLKTVIHVHTNYSHDSNRSPAELVETAVAQGVDCIAVTDHDEIEGALRAQSAGGVRVIVGEEISSSDGHIIGLFLRQRVSPGMSAEDTARAIRAQGGLVLAPHPYAMLCEDSLTADGMRRLLPWLDAVEVCNSQNLFVWEEARAREFCVRHQVTPYAGADAHIQGYLAGAYQLMPDFSDPPSFLKSLRRATLVPARFALGYYLAMGGRHLWEKTLRRRMRGYGVNAPEPI